jgi:hypothetical protein
MNDDNNRARQLALLDRLVDDGIDAGELLLAEPEFLRGRRGERSFGGSGAWRIREYHRAAKKQNA